MNYHTIDSNGYYIRSYVIDPYGPLPGRGTQTDLPEITEDKFAFWNGADWELHDEKPAEDLRPYKDAKMKLVTEFRWKKETGGIVVGDSLVATGIADQNRITSTISNAELAGVTELDFKTVNGWVTITVDQVKGIAAAIALHVQSCFTKERILCEAIDLLETAQEINDFNIAEQWDATP